MSDADFRRGMGIIDAAVDGFAAELGRQIQAQRIRVDLSTESLAEILSMAELPMQPADVERLEAGQGPTPDIKLLVALAFVLEISTDQVTKACLKQASTKALRTPKPPL